MDKEINADIEMVDAEQFGFTEEDLKGFIPDEKQDEKPVESTDEKSVETVETEHVETETAPDSEPKESVPEEHADNLKAALKEERARRKALRDELDALKAQYSQQPAQQPAQQSPDVMQDIKKQARAKAIESLKIEGNPSDLMFADPDKYEEFVSERARLEYEAIHTYREQQKTYGENVNFINELRSIPEFPVVFNYAMAELDDMPRKESRKIEEAYNRVDRGQGNKDDFAVLREFVSTCQKKLSGTNVTPQPTTTTLSGKLDQVAQLPKATQLGGGKTTQMSWAEVERLAKAEKWDEIPKEMLLKLDPTGELLK